jgi:S-adenosylmethionine decarboxylase
MQGTHLTADLADCDMSRIASGVARAAEAAQPSKPHDAMHDPAVLRTLCLQAVKSVGLTPVGELFHAFGVGQGVTGVVLLAESHLAVHTWPEKAAVTVDVYVCNLNADNSAAAHALMDQLTQAFHPGRVQQHTLVRGTVGQA